MLLCYPVITSGPCAHAESIINLLGPEHAADPRLRSLVSLEQSVSADTPPVFLWHTWEDATVPAENSLLLAQALKAAGVSLELHIYPRGCHGLSLANSEVSGPGKDCVEPRCQDWINLARAWIADFPYAPVCQPRS